MIVPAQSYPELSGPVGQAAVRPEEFAVVKRDVQDIKELMKALVEAVTRIALLEQRSQANTETTNKILERCERIELRQQRADIDNATNASNAKRLDALEGAFREMHVEGERVKASFNTTKRLVQAGWAVIGSGGALWIFQKMVQQAAVVGGGA